MSANAPTATYRLQLTPAFGFDAVRQTVPYLHSLGISHVYLSPPFETRAGSQHGYDVTNPTQLRSELGGEEMFVELAHTARQLGMAIIIDIVPNHMAADVANPWWADVLMHGQQSRYAKYFDIDWDAGDGRIILPVLGRPLRDAIAANELTIEQHAKPFVRYFERTFPIAPGTNLDNPLAHVLDEQAYRLVDWQSGNLMVNYRRFFHINDLVAVRMEDAAVFEASHELIFKLVEDGLIAGVRVDHIDGLADPHAYLQQLRSRLDAISHSGSQPIILIEKILAEGEALPDEWACDGTTGYEFSNAVLHALLDKHGAREILAAAEASGTATHFGDLAVRCKIEVAHALFAADLNRLTRAFNATFDAASVSPNQRPTFDELAQSLVHVSAALPVYRTYITQWPVPQRDRESIEAALEHAQRLHLFIHPLLTKLLLGDVPFTNRATAAAWHRAVSRWQQFTGPLAAKGVEDTALYRHIALVALNTVGGHPAVARERDADLLHVVREHLRRPRSLNATSTHDTKRGEDTRLRIAALSQCSDQWLAMLRQWCESHAAIRQHAESGPAPSDADSLLIYQSLLGIWQSPDEPVTALAQRMAQYMTKASREASLRTSWQHPNAAYEAAVHDFVRELVLGERGQRFRDDAEVLSQAMAFFGTINSISQIALKAMLPGVPDFYQGSELWDLSLVDPDNRRPVDFASRQRMLQELHASLHKSRAACIEDVLAHWFDGRIKLFATAAALQVRAEHDQTLQYGELLALQVTGKHAHHAMGFARRFSQNKHEQWLAVIVPRCASRVTPSNTFPMGPNCWDDTSITLTESAPTRWTEAYSHVQVQTRRANDLPQLCIGETLQSFPAAILISE